MMNIIEHFIDFFWERPSFLMEKWSIKEEHFRGDTNTSLANTTSSV